VNNDIRATLDQLVALSEVFGIDEPDDFITAVEAVKAIRALETIYTVKLRTARNKMDMAEQIQLQQLMQDNRIRETRYKSGIHSDYARG
jgi:hypothetical protein